jgi:hypothetical protein
MSVYEVIFRIYENIKKNNVQINFQKKDSQISYFPIKIFDKYKLKSEAGENKNYIFDVEFKPSADINWHYDKKYDVAFPKKYFAKINIRKENSGSIKYVWEVNRLQYLADLAIRYSISADIKYFSLFSEIMESWIEGNPYLEGINWYSNLEVNLRLITWFLCWEIFDVNELIKENEEIANFVNNKWLPTIYLHCLYSYEHPSRFSSANNHLISEAAGLFISSSYWKFKESPKWNKYSKRILEAEILNQHSQMGVNREEASGYIQFITDFFLISYVVGEKTENSFSDCYKQYLEKIFNYIYNLVDISGNIPQYGDEDDGKVFILEFGKKVNNLKSLLTSGAILFQDSKLKSMSDGFDEKNDLLFGKNGGIVFDSIPLTTSIRKSKFYIDEGHFLFRKENNGKEIYMHYDSAPIGYLSIAAHGHADALSFTLNLDGVPFLIDPGTYTYHTELEWRNYFKSTLAHNTICVDGQNQALVGGPTLWLKHYNCKTIESYLSDDTDYVQSTHDGYKSIGVEHIREIFFMKKENRFIITDQLIIKNDKEHSFEIPFHIHPDIKVDQIEGNAYNLFNTSKRKMVIKFDKTLNPILVKGETKPIMGWYSSSFYQKEPTYTIYANHKSNSSFKLKTIIQIEE